MWRQEHHHHLSYIFGSFPDGLYAVVSTSLFNNLLGQVLKVVSKTPIVDAKCHKTNAINPWRWGPLKPLMSLKTCSKSLASRTFWAGTKTPAQSRCWGWKPERLRLLRRRKRINYKDLLCMRSFSTPRSFQQSSWTGTKTHGACSIGEHLRLPSKTPCWCLSSLSVLVVSFCSFYTWKPVT